MFTFRLGTVPLKGTKTWQWKLTTCDIHSSLHHQGAYACVEACLQQVHGSISQHHSATSAAHLTEQHDGWQRELLNKKTREVHLSSGSSTKTNSEWPSERTILTCPTVCTEQTLVSEDRKPMASVLGYSPFSSKYMFSVNWAPSYATQLTHRDTCYWCHTALQFCPQLFFLNEIMTLMRFNSIAIPPIWCGWVHSVCS